MVDTPAEGLRAKAAEIIEAAAHRIDVYGWTQGAHARTTEEGVCPVMDMNAAYFSIYGAIYRESLSAGIADGDNVLQNGGVGRLIWETLTRQAAKERVAYTGVHPVIEFNDARGRTQAEVTGFLRDCANLLKTPTETQK